MNSKAKIIATIGPSCAKVPILVEMIAHQMDVARLNLAWGTIDEHAELIKAIREAEKISGRKVLIMLDLPGPRIQNVGSHAHETSATSALTERDKELIKFGIDQGVDYFAESFVGDEDDIKLCRETIHKHSGSQRIVAKIERSVAVSNISKIIEASDAIMIARGDLGNEVPLEQIPFIQDRIVKETKKARKPVIVATQMLVSMVGNHIPTRADVTDIAYAILTGADAVMLSEETATGKFPVEAVTMMEKVVLEAEKHMGSKSIINPL